LTAAAAAAGQGRAGLSPSPLKIPLSWEEMLWAF
jgi:hypothetical protein